MGEIAYVALGSNLGDRTRALALARAALRALPGTRVIAEPPVEETAPFGPPGQHPYLNQMLAIETTLSPHELLAQLHDIERAAGRTRRVRWGPRTLYLYIVRFGDRTLRDDQLELPRRGRVDRDFWEREVACLEAAMHE